MKEDFTYCDKVTVDEESKSAYVDRFVKKTMQIHCFEDAVVYPWISGKEYIQGEVFNTKGERVDGVNSETIYDEKLAINHDITDITTEDEAIYIGSQNMCWGHYFTDGISKLWCLNTPEFNSLVQRGVPIFFVSDDMQVEAMPPEWKHLVDLLGGEKLMIQPLRNITRVHKLYVPTNSLFNTTGGRCFTQEYIQLAQQLRVAALQNHRDWPRYNRIYLSRTHLTSDHGEFGEKFIEKAFRKTGFHILYPEELSFEQQVWYLSNAKEVAGTMGSISHNFLFCRPDTRAYVVRKAWYTNDFQYVINQVAKLNVTYIDAHLSVFINSNSNDGPFFMYCNDNLTRFISDNFEKYKGGGFNRKLFANYVMLCMKRPNFNQRILSPQFYYDKMHMELNTHQEPIKVVYHTLLDMFGNNDLSKQMKLFVKKITR